mgnify:CR=1 FL=1|jgi:hypothetical protein
MHCGLACIMTRLAICVLSLLQVLFNKLQSTKFQGPTHQGGVQPGH